MRAGSLSGNHYLEEIKKIHHNSITEQIAEMFDKPLYCLRLVGKTIFKLLMLYPMDFKIHRDGKGANLREHS
ncbi:hypothetical protein [Photorhabdus luminescens]|uniref:Uncharacterized protein n=1 Tax=Photorhabdus luminescens subsp. sonorensis TaxID=1173677 RepID=A0A5C4RJJ2_PHOLU|nr:hypothetical protein [Photorhabdus luminescens]TNH44018.1 hypothetical protein EP164_08495 [Photorhabdus luminescens subsp. sonorensis]